MVNVFGQILDVFTRYFSNISGKLYTAVDMVITTGKTLYFGTVNRYISDMSGNLWIMNAESGKSVLIDGYSSVSLRVNGTAKLLVMTDVNVRSATKLSLCNGNNNYSTDLQQASGSGTDCTLTCPGEFYCDVLATMMANATKSGFGMRYSGSTGERPVWYTDYFRSEIITVSVGNTYGSGSTTLLPAGHVIMGIVAMVTQGCTGASEFRVSGHAIHATDDNRYGTGGTSLGNACTNMGSGDPTGGAVTMFPQFTNDVIGITTNAAVTGTALKVRVTTMTLTAGFM